MPKFCLCRAKKLHSEELLNLYSSPNIIRIIKSRRMRWAGHVTCMGDKRNAYRVLVGKPEGKRPLRKSRRRWEDNIKINLRYIGWVTWTGQEAVEGPCKHGNEPSG
jgi:hypothetical protein